MEDLYINASAERMEHHTKINLNLKDLKHLQSQLSKNAMDKINLYLPTTDSSDVLKTRVIQLINDFVYEILEDAKHGLEIDGFNSEDSLRRALENPTDETEPFDFSLQDQVRKLYQQVEERTIKLTKLRRETPVSLKRKYAESFETSISRLRSLEKELQDEQLDKEDFDLGENDFDKLVKAKESGFERNVKSRLDDIIKSYESSINEIKAIKETIPTERNEIDKIEKITKFLSEEK